MTEQSVWDQMSDDLINDPDFGIDAVFYPNVGDAVDLKVFFDQDYEGHPGAFTQRASGYQMTVEYLLADIGRLAEPHERFVFSGATYEVITPVEHERGGRFVKVIVK